MRDESSPIDQLAKELRTPETVEPAQARLEAKPETSRNEPATTPHETIRQAYRPEQS